AGKGGARCRKTPAARRTGRARRTRPEKPKRPGGMGDHAGRGAQNSAAPLCCAQKPPEQTWSGKNMCGIVGWIDYAGVGPDAEIIAERMNGAQYHRGPDGGGTWLSRFAVLAHRRLAVIDVQNGAQPMAFPGTPDSEARLVLTYNGELYNYRELRKELEARGHRFRTAGATEIVLTAWAE